MQMPRLNSIWVAACLCAQLLSANAALAQSGDEELRDVVNAGTVGIVSGGVTGTYIQIAADLANVFDDGDSLRILPLVGEGSVQNVTDVLYLKGIDIGIVQSDTLAVLKQQAVFPGLEKRINYITKLYNEEFHLVAGPDITTIQDLQGKKVNLGNPGGGTYMTATTVFDLLGITIEPVSVDQAEAIEQIRTGQIAATIYIAGKPASVVSEIKGGQGLHLVEIPFTGKLRDIYFPSSFTSEDYPQLVAPGQNVDTLAIGAVMAVFNWRSDSPRYKKVERFIEAFFSRFEELQHPPHHPKWREVNLSTELPGWTRFPPAKAWLAKREQFVGSIDGGSSIRQDFQAFLTQAGGNKLSAEEQESLFKLFLRWRSKNPSQ